MAVSKAPFSEALLSARWLSTLSKSRNGNSKCLHGHVRYAHIKSTPSSRPPSKAPRMRQEAEQQVLEKPDRYRKPSHPARIPRRSSLAGPPLSEQEIEAQKTKQYPNMFPPEGSTMHWFLTNRRIHLVITFGILGSLGSFVWVETFRSSLIPQHYELLPSWSLLPFHPIEFMSRFIDVYRLHVARVSNEVDFKRQQNVADARKRELYRKEHGIEIQSIPNMLGFRDEKVEGPQAQTSEAASTQAVQQQSQQADTMRDTDPELEPSSRKQKTSKWAPFGISW